EGTAEHETVGDRADAFEHEPGSRLQKDALLRFDRLLFVEGRSSFVDRKERDEERSDPFAQQRLSRRQIERAALMKFRNDLGRIIARQRERAIGGEHTASHEKFAEGIVWW